MTKIQRTILEQAYVNVLVDSVQQGDSWGYIDIDGFELKDEALLPAAIHGDHWRETLVDVAREGAQFLFENLGESIRAAHKASDERLLEIVFDVDVETYINGADGIGGAPTFDTFNELNTWVEENYDGGDLQSLAALSIAFLQAGGKIAS
jgi:hypothetical protein